MHLNLHDPHTRNRVLVAAAALGLVVALVLRHRTATTASTTAAVGPLFDPAAGLDTSGLGTTTGIPGSLSGGGGDPGTGVAAADPVTVDLTPINDAAQAVADAAASITGLFTDWATTPSNDGSGGTSAPPFPSPPQNVPAPKAPSATARGVWWGGKFMTSISQIAAYERAHGNSGFNASLWAAQHPDAARILGVTPPPPPSKKSQPSPSAPVTIAPLSAVAISPPPPSPIALAPTAVPPPPPMVQQPNPLIPQKGKVILE